MSMVRNIAGIAAGVLLMCATPVLAAGASSGEFAAGKFTCLDYTNGLGEKSAGRAQSSLARLWMSGYLAGFFKAQGKLELDGEAKASEQFDNFLLQTCRQYPQSSIFAVSMQALTKDARKVPTAPVLDFTPQGYTCEQHVAAKGGAAADANRADLAEFWAFAFIQGFKNVASPDMEIPAENKPQLVGAVTNTCAKNPKVPFMDLTALVAEKVKLQ